MREATIHIPDTEFENLGLAEFLALVDEAGLRDLSELVCQSDGCLLVVTLDTPIDADTLDSLDYLAWWERLSGSSEGHTYLCKVRADSSERDILSMEELGIPNTEIRVGDDGITVSLVGDQEDLSKGIDAYESAGLSVYLQRIADYDGPRTPLDALTRRQREILRTAFNLGYFDVPRQVSTADVAEELDLDGSTVAEHLQRAERNLLSELLATP